MKRILCLLPGVVFLAGCPEREPLALNINGVLRPDDGCIFAAGGPRAGGGQLDLVLASQGYLLGVEFSNLLPSSLAVSGLSAEAAQLEANGIQLTGALVSYRVPPELSVSLPDHFQPLGQIALPGATGAAGIEALPPQVVDLLRTDSYLVGEREIADPLVKACLESRATSQADLPPRLKDVPLSGRTVDIEVNLQLEAITQAGVDVLSNDLQFVVRVCNGCLVAPGADSTWYLLEREANQTQFCADADAAFCRPGADGCQEQLLCIDRYNNVDQAIAEKLQKCAEDPSFPSAALSGIGHPLCKDMPPAGPAALQTRYEHLACRYGLEKADAFCAGDAGQLYPPQQ